ncbi:MAG: oligopeptide transport system permease protein [Phycisphaerales bacterium]|jgi:oligopeptide transport system permease protein
MPQPPAAPSPETAIPDLAAPAPRRRNPLTHSKAGVLGLAVLGSMLLLCLGTLPWTLTTGEGTDVPRYNQGVPREGRMPPLWWPYDEIDVQRSMDAVRADPGLADQTQAIALAAGLSLDDALALREGPVYEQLRDLWPRFLLGSDQLGRSLLYRVLTGGGISLVIGIAAALISVGIGTLYGAFAGYAGGWIDGLLMRIVDVLYGLPYILLVVLIAVAVDGYIENQITKSGIEMSAARRTQIDVVTLLVAISAVSWLTMARVVRGQVLSLKNQPFVEAARAMGARPRRVFLRHLLPNLIGPIVVYATLAVPQAILQESFLSFLGIGVKPPLPSWGNLAADGLSELNGYRSNWWLLFFPCALLGVALLALNFVGEGLREAFDPKSGGRS